MVQNFQIKILDLDAKDVNRMQGRLTFPEEGGKRFKYLAIHVVFHHLLHWDFFQQLFWFPLH